MPLRKVKLVMLFLTGLGLTGVQAQTAIDIDGNVYNTVTIGTQTWMTENLKTAHYDDGTAIPLISDNTAWSALSTPGYCWYNNDEATYKATYGALYNWYAVDAASNGGKNVCPAGWHVPSDAEWTTLTTYLGGEGVAGGKMKETGIVHWNSPNTGATNESGFIGLPNGARYDDGSYYGIGLSGDWWSSTEYISGSVWTRCLFYSMNNVQRDNFITKVFGTSVRCLEDKTEYNSLIFTSNTNGFSIPDLFTNSKANIYYYYDLASSNVIPGVNYNFILNSNGFQIPCVGTAIDGGVFRLIVDLANINQTGNITIALPDVMGTVGQLLTLNNKPSSLSKEIKIRPIEQTINVFAGNSAGAKFIAGGVGAGASIAAASLSLEVAGGMGLDYTRENSGDDMISRRFEGSITASVECPSINGIVGKIQVGASGDLSAKAYVGQTLLIPKNLSTIISQEAKAAFLLETLTLGNFELSPFAGIFLKALKTTLIQSNPDLSIVYTDLLYSNEVGLGLEGSSSLGVTITSGKKPNLLEIELPEIGSSFAINADKTDYLQSEEVSVGIEASSSYSVSALDFKFLNADFGNQLSLDYGMSFSEGANFSNLDGFNSLELSFKAAPTAQISLLSYSPSESYDFLVPKAAILRNFGSSSLLNSLSSALSSTGSLSPIKVGVDYLNDQLHTLYSGNPENLSVYEDHVISQITKSRLIGLNLSTKVDLDGALGVGAGLLLGIQGSYFDELKYPKKEFALSQGIFYPMVEYNDIPDNFNLITFQDELTDLFSGAVSLISTALNNLIQTSQQVITAGSAFILYSIDAAFTLSGILSNSGNIVVRALDPTYLTISKALFEEPRLITAYSSHRIINSDNTKGTLSVESNEHTLYIISQTGNITLFDNQGNIIPTFDPLSLSVKMDSVKLSQLIFGDDEKKLAKLYFYKTDSLAWIEVPGNTSTDLNVVTTLITKSGSYAVGIELKPSDDKTAPQILDYSPKSTESTNFSPLVWVKITDGPTGVGIDFSRTMLKIDNVEVSASWDPVNGIISTDSLPALSSGVHSFTIIAVDYNGNTNEMNISFNAQGTTSISTPDSRFEFTLFPNPATYRVSILVTNPNPGSLIIDVFNQSGEKVSLIYNNPKADPETELNWNLTGENGLKLTSGIYFIRIKNNDHILVKKLIIK